MKIPEKPHLNSYEAALTDEQWAAFRAILLSGITLAVSGGGGYLRRFGAQLNLCNRLRIGVAGRGPPPGTLRK